MATQMARLYFEQIPVDMVKQIPGLEELSSEVLRPELLRPDQDWKEWNDSVSAERAASVHPRSMSSPHCRRPIHLVESERMASTEIEDVPYPLWQLPVLTALVEPDREKNAVQIAVAKAAIASRLQAISQDTNHYTERHAIQDALALLRILETECSAA